MNARRATRLATLLALTTALLGTVAVSSASAANSYNGAAYISGGGSPFDDWDDEGILSTTTNTRSNATCLWQKVLWANGKLAWNDIDGVFGTKTVEATKSLQQDLGVPADGAVGKATFKAAGHGGNWGIFADATGNNADLYVGWSGEFQLSRDASGNYQFYDRTGAKRAAGYNYLTCA